MFILFLTLLFPPAVLAQVKGPVPVVSLDMKNVPLESVLKELEKQTGMFFSYESSLLADISKVSIRVEDASFTFCLSRLFENLPLTYRITGQYVILKAKPRQYTISGFVRDSVSYESFINATVLDMISGKGVTTNNYGFFSITLPAGPVSLRSSYVGFTIREWTFELKKDTMIDFLLPPSGALGEIVVTGNNPFSEVMSSRMGTLDLTFSQMRESPGFLSEDDPVKIIHRMPGISFGTEGLTGVYVRGGTGDDNLFLVDGVPLYSIHHVGGLVSTFNPDVIKNIDFYKGGFPARYGGRLSSVMDVRLKEGDKDAWHGNVSIGFISAKAQIEGPLIKDRTTFNMAFRRTWLDAITTPFFAISNRKENGETFGGYSFYDWNAKITHYFEDQSRLNINFYMGQDRLRSKDRQDYWDDKKGDDTKWRWGNVITSVNWNKAFNPKLYGNFQLAYTRYKSKMEQVALHLPYFYYYGSGKPVNLYSTEESHHSGIEDLTFRAEFDYSPHHGHLIRFGSDYLYHIYKPEYRTYTHGTKVDEEWRYNQYEYVDQNVYAHEWSLYAEDDWSVNERWKINAGGRIGSYHVEGKSYISFQPRLSVRYLLTPDMSLKASYAKMNQYVHKLSSTIFNLPSDILVPVTAGVKPMNTHLVSAGWYYSLAKEWDMSVEGYFRKINHLIDYKDYASLFPQYAGWDKKISVGSGRSYGVEYMLRKSAGRTSGWAAYTLSWTDRLYKDGSVNYGFRFPDKYDNRHKLNITLMHKLSNKIDVSAGWMYASGNRVTAAVDNYFTPDLNYSPSQFYVNYDVVYRKNAYKMRDYHRLDVSFNFYRPKKKGRMGIWNLSIYNLYSRMNSLYAKGVYHRNDKYYIQEKGVIPVIPTFSYTYKF